MKKFLSLIFILFLGMPTLALCSIGDGESVCTLPNSSSSMPLFQNNMGINTQNTNSSNLKTPNPSQNSSNLNSSFGRTKNQDGVQMQGSLGCQFGNCNKDINNR